MNEAPWPWESRITGSEDPVVGTVNRTCNGTARDDEGSVMGVIEMVGVAMVTEILLSLSIRACSASGDDVDCIMVDFAMLCRGYVLVRVLRRWFVTEV